MEERVLLAACLAHIKRADGSQAKDWSIAQTAWRASSEILKKYQAHSDLPDGLTEAAFAASEDLRTSAASGYNWPAAQAQAERVLPVVQQVLYTVATLPDTANKQRP